MMVKRGTLVHVLAIQHCDVPYYTDSVDGASGGYSACEGQPTTGDQVGSSATRVVTDRENLRQDRCGAFAYTTLNILQSTHPAEFAAGWQLAKSRSHRTRISWLNMGHAVARITFGSRSRSEASLQESRAIDSGSSLFSGVLQVQTNYVGVAVRAVGRLGRLSVLCKHDLSENSVGQDIVFTLKESQNLHAELLLHELGGLTYGGATGQSFGAGRCASWSTRFPDACRSRRR